MALLGHSPRRNKREEEEGLNSGTYLSCFSTADTIQLAAIYSSPWWTVSLQRLAQINSSFLKVFFVRYFVTVGREVTDTAWKLSLFIIFPDSTLSHIPKVLNRHLWIVWSMIWKLIFCSGYFPKILYTQTAWAKCSINIATEDSRNLWNKLSASWWVSIQISFCQRHFCE